MEKKRTETDYGSAFRNNYIRLKKALYQKTGKTNAWLTKLQNSANTVRAGYLYYSMPIEKANLTIQTSNVKDVIWERYQRHTETPVSFEGAFFDSGESTKAYKSYDRSNPED
eukprot:9907762-Ditylum_brightwellii.AAC.1